MPGQPRHERHQLRRGAGGRRLADARLPPVLVWIEDYTATPLREAEFARVEFAAGPGMVRFSSPRWNAVDRWEVEALIAQPVSQF